MTIQFSPEDLTGDIVTHFPKASQLFKTFRIDFCCGGNRKIGEVLQDKGLNQEQVLGELNQLYREAQAQNEMHEDFQAVSYSSLIEHVIKTHHSYLNDILPELYRFTNKVYHVHGQNHPELEIVFQLFTQLKNDLEHHLQEEEARIFPKVKAYEQRPSKEELKSLLLNINTLEAEHQSAGDLLRELREVTNDYLLPADACNTYRLTYLKLIELENDMFHHIHLENNILFLRLEREYAV